MDIGAKFCCIDFLNKNNIHFDFILMLHSKSNYFKRKQYFDSIILQLENIVPKLDTNDGIYTINSLYIGDRIFIQNIYNKFVNWGNNSIHMNFLINKFNLPNFNYVFAEGNVYILHKEVANYIFDNRFNLYNKLNYENSFDYSWFIHYYKVTHLTYNQAFHKYKTESLFGNNVSTKKGWNGLADCMVEHAFERIPFGVCKLLNKKINIINYDKNTELNDYVINNINSYKNTLSIIECHTNTELKLQTLINNIKYLNDISDEIYIINSNEFKDKIEFAFLNSNEINNNFIINNNLTDIQAKMYLDQYCDIKEILITVEKAKEHYKLYGYNEKRKISKLTNIFIFYQEDTNLIYGDKWYNCLERIKDKFSHFILTNDSFLIINNLNMTKYNITEEFTDFDPDMYKDLHSDLFHLNTKEATEHFYKYGIYEGRKYKKDQELIIPEYLKNKLPIHILKLLNYNASIIQYNF
jgi:hypothetical protein